MAYARYPNLRNYNKRCELETMIFNLRALRNAQAAADEAAWEKHLLLVHPALNSTTLKLRRIHDAIKSMRISKRL